MRRYQFDPGLGTYIPSKQRGFMSNEFLTDLFGDQEGIIYAPVKYPNSFKQYFFDWPQERDKLERHLDDYGHRDVYLSPALFSERRISPETFKGTNYLWSEFDGTTPTNAIEPSIRVSSSASGHEHWYWKLDNFVTDVHQIEDLNRRIAYHYGADLSVWDYQNVLRPVDTWNHKRNKPVTLLSKNDTLYALDHFFQLPIPPAGSKVEVKLGSLPSRDSILAKYKWTYDALDMLFKDEVPVGSRSSALARLVHECLELGLSNEETYVLIEDRDSKWGKYVGRSDRQKRLEATIANVRGRKSFVAEVTQGAPEVYRFGDFMRTNIKLKWAIEGLLPVAGSMVIFGKPGIGKSTFSLRLAIDLALGKDHFLLWPIINKQRVLFISLEMQHYELKEFFEDMQLPEEESVGLQEQFFIWPIGSAYPFDTPDQQLELLKYIRLHKIELIIIDSLSLSMYGSVKNDDDIKRLNSFLNEDVRRDLKCGYMFIHHPRKEGMDQEKKNLTQDDLFGSQYIAANAQTIVTITSKTGSPRVHVQIVKTRMATGLQDFFIERTPNRGFQLVDKTTVIPESQADTHKKPDAGSLGKLLAF
jgi:archaellum biogenesis ATPase FlaH